MEKDSDNHGIHSVAGAAESAGGEDVADAADVENYINEKYYRAEPDDFLVVGKKRQYRMSRQRKRSANYQRDYQRITIHKIAHQEGSYFLFCANEMPHYNATALHHAYAKQVDKHNAISTICASCERRVAELIDEIRNCNLRKAITQIFARRRHADFEDVFEFSPRERSKPRQGILVDVFFGVDDAQRQHRNAATNHRGNRRALHAKFWQSKMSEYQRIIAYDVDNIDDNGNAHRIFGHSRAPQRCRKRQPYRLKKRKTSNYPQIRGAVVHKFGGEIHKFEHCLGLQAQKHAHHAAHHGIDQQRDAHDLHEFFLETRADILCAHDARTNGHKLEYQYHKVKQLVVQPNCRHSIVAAALHAGIEMAEHHRIHRAQKHHKGNFHKNRLDIGLQFSLQVGRLRCIIHNLD